MALLASLFVEKPWNVLLVAGAFLLAYLVLRVTSIGAGRRSRPLFIAAVTWSLYAVWEWLVQVSTPEANIRVDLLVIWPAVAILSGWALFRAIR